MTTDRRGLLKAMAVAPLLAPEMLRAQDLSRIAMAPIEVREDRVWMPVRLNGGDPLPFVLDTGAVAHLIREDLAHELDLVRVGSLAVHGLGGRDRFVAYRAPDVSIGDVRVGAITFAAYRPPLVINPAARGALAATLLTAADSDLDFDAGLWRLHIDGRGDRSGFESLPSAIRAESFDSGAAQILVDAAIDGETYRLQVDTGSPSEIMLTPSGTRRSGLWNETTPFAPHRRRGVGGDGGRARLVRARRASLGGISFDRPLVSLTDPEQARTIDSDGLVGIGLIERMNLSTDIRARRLWAQRNARPKRPERYGMSGLWLEERRGTVVVEVVGTGSPAAAAGLRIGDRLSGGTLPQWIRRLAGRPGASIEIPYQRDGESRTATLTLREYL